VLGTVRSLPAAQLPSANVAVQIGECGVERVASSIPFGASGEVLVCWSALELKSLPGRVSKVEELLSCCTFADCARSAGQNVCSAHAGPVATLLYLYPEGGSSPV
jgi:hypothetical protein